MENEIKPKPEGITTPHSINTPPQKSKKIIPIIIALVALIAIGGVIYWQYIRIPKEDSQIGLLEGEETEIISEEAHEEKIEGQETYKNKEVGIMFNYPSSWGEITEEINEDYACITFSDFSPLENFGQIRITDVQGIRNYLNSLKGKNMGEYYQFLEERYKEVWSGSCACPTGPVGYMLGVIVARESEGEEIGKDIETELEELSNDLNSLSLLEPGITDYLDNYSDPENPDEEVIVPEEGSIIHLGSTLAYIFSDGLGSIIDYPVKTVANKDNSLIGLALVTHEGFDTGSTIFAETIFTSKEDASKVILLKFDADTSIWGDEGEMRNALDKIMKEKKIVEDSIKFTDR